MKIKVQSAIDRCVVVFLAIGGFFILACATGGTSPSTEVSRDKVPSRIVEFPSSLTQRNTRVVDVHRFLESMDLTLPFSTSRNDVSLVRTGVGVAQVEDRRGNAWNIRLPTGEIYDAILFEWQPAGPLGFNSGNSLLLGFAKYEDTISQLVAGSRPRIMPLPQSSPTSSATTRSTPSAVVDPSGVSQANERISEAQRAMDADRRRQAENLKALDQRLAENQRKRNEAFRNNPNFPQGNNRDNSYFSNTTDPSSAHQYKTADPDSPAYKEWKARVIREHGAAGAITQDTEPCYLCGRTYKEPIHKNPATVRR